MLPPHLVIDEFLPPELHDGLLQYALAHEADFARSHVRRDGQAYHSEDRRSWSSAGELDGLKQPFQAAVLEALPSLFATLGIEPFEPHVLEVEMSAHRDGDYFRPHWDTMHSVNRTRFSDRVITAVYYFHAQPRGFSGGEFAIHPFGEGDPVLIEPRDNRLLAIPAFAMHEVKPIEIAGDDFRSARFAVNAWVHRSRKPAAQ
jgi:SM-20-related protein